MTEAIFALLGVVVGGLITAGTDYWMERKREDRDIQAAARRAYLDLYACYVSIRMALEPRGVIQVNEMGTRLSRYREHAAIFAVHLRIKEYLVVSRTVRRLSLFVQQAEARPAPAITENMRRELETLGKQTEDAGDILLEAAIRDPRTCGCSAGSATRVEGSCPSATSKGSPRSSSSWKTSSDRRPNRSRIAATTLAKKAEPRLTHRVPEGMEPAGRLRAS